MKIKVSIQWRGQEEWIRGSSKEEKKKLETVETNFIRSEKCPRAVISHTARNKTRQKRRTFAADIMRCEGLEEAVIIESI